jgi:hypothetical protein
VLNSPNWRKDKRYYKFVYKINPKTALLWNEYNAYDENIKLVELFKTISLCYKLHNCSDVNIEEIRTLTECIQTIQ